MSDTGHVGPCVDGPYDGLKYHAVGDTFYAEKRREPLHSLAVRDDTFKARMGSYAWLESRQCWVWRP
jgi:hypothetical protein